MHRAMELARLGFGYVSPNPMVGCVIVHNNKIIGEGFHRQFGGPHAEVNAINSVDDKSLLPASQVYVTLEPCSFFGKTPPCADLLAKHKVGSVFIANIDPNPKVSGKGIGILRKAGIEVEEGILEIEGRGLNKRFFTSFGKERPYVILKWAQTADGYVARKNFDSKWISNKYSRKIVHKWRAEEDAILVGKNTAMYDNPNLNVREWAGNNPVRIVVDHHLRLGEHLNLFNREIPTICYNLKQDRQNGDLDFVKLSREDFLNELLADLHQRNIQSVMIEGGTVTINKKKKKGLWDEARVFVADICFGEGIMAPRLMHAEFEGKETIMGDTLTYFKRNDIG